MQITNAMAKADQDRRSLSFLMDSKYGVSHHWLS